MDVKIRLSFPSLNTVSDLSLRRLLKALSRALHRVIEAELGRLLDYLDLTPNERRSIETRLERHLHTAPNYYLETLIRGSFDILATVAEASKSRS